MPLIQFEFRNIRLYEHARLDPDPRLTLVTGANASGKTTLLEAIHVLSTGRSFRTPKVDQLLRHGSTQLSVIGQYQPLESKNTVRLGLTHSEQGRRIRIDNSESTRIADLAQQLPLLVISPDSHFEFQQSARERRGALDWVLFHVEPDFQDLWGRYQRSLQQRNSALKDPKHGRSRFSWDEELASLGEVLQKRRNDRIAELIPYFETICRQLLGSSLAVNLILDPGWNRAHGLSRCLAEDRSRDVARGYTHSGPHRNDLRILIDNQASRDEASHGQNKLLVIALRVAQIQYLHATTGRECCLLIDDLAAELDVTHRNRLAKFLAGLPVQVFITATDPGQIEVGHWSSHRKFHVEHGHLREH